MKNLFQHRFFDRAQNDPNETAYALYTEKTAETIAISNQSLQLSAQILSEHFRDQKTKAAILLFDEHDPFIRSFLACVYTDVIAIPMAPPNSRHPWDLIEKVVQETEASIILTSPAVIKNFKRRNDDQHILTDLLFDITTLNKTPNDQQWKPTVVAPDDIALLQYTSGSTGSPKGVQITHANIASNLEQIQSRFESTPQSSGVIWLPPYHDMGLIGGILLPLYTGFPTTFMSSVSFFKSPIKWLKLIATQPDVISGGPNFAFDLCIDKISPEDCEGLDLSSWNVAFSGAEKIRYETIQNFVAKFSPYGFKQSAFLTCYGMAESTLMISGIQKSESPHFLNVDKSDKANNKITLADVHSSNAEWLVSSGKAIENCTLAIVSPENQQILPDAHIGEIWVSGNSISRGYWKKTTTNQALFGQHLVDKTGFLRTGDLGFIHNQQVYVTGRLKELIIINGRNFYPQDIEQTTSATHPALHACTACFFSIYDQGKQHLLLIQEVKRTEIRNIDSEAITVAIQNAVASCHGIRIAGVFLVRPGTIPLTSSGKIRRFQVKEQFQQGQLDDKIIGKRCDASINALFGKKEQDTTIRPTSTYEANGQNKQEAAADAIKAQEMIAWLREYNNTRLNSKLMDERRSLTPNVVLDFGNQGFLGMQIPKAYGGLGMSFVNSIQVFRQLSSIDLSLGMFVGINHSLGTRPIVNYAQQHLKNEILPQIATGRELAAFAFTEPAAGSNPRGIRSVGDVIGKNKWNINGQKEWIGLGTWSSTISTFVHLRDEQGKFMGITGFALRQGDKGLRMGPEALTMGVRNVIQNKIYLDDVVVSDDRLLGALGNGMEVAQDVMAHARFGIGCACLGALQKCAQLGLRYTQRRNISTGNLLQNPMTLSKLSRLTAIIPAAELLLFRIGALLDARFDVPEDAFNACKIILPELLWESIDDMAQLLGGRGFIEANIIPQMMRDARVLRIFEGPTETLKMHLGSQTIRDNSKIIRLIEVGLQAPETSARYQKALEEIRSVMERSTLFTTKTKNDQWFYLKIGEISAYAIMLAAMTGKGSEQWKSAQNKRSLEWINITFDTCIENTLKESKFDPLIVSSDQITEQISAYTDVIGDLEQTLPGEEHVLDPFLRKQFSNAPKNNARTQTTIPASTAQNLRKNTAVPSEYLIPDGPKKQHQETIKQWITNWVISRLNLPQEMVNQKGNTFFDLGMDSLTSIDFVAALETWLKKELDTSIVWNYPTIESLAEHLCELTVPETLKNVEQPTKSHQPATTIAPGHYQFELNNRSTHLQQQLMELEQSEEPSPYFKSIEGVSNDTVSIANQKLINFAGYNYLGLSGDPRVLEFAQQAIEQYGTSVSASRVISGEIKLHAQLEKLLCQTIGFDACVVLTAGHATNVTTIGHLFGPKDLIVYDAFIHSSILDGAKMAGATRISFPHNDLESLNQILTKQRSNYEQTIIISEGVYSMDGDIIDLPGLIELKKQHQCYLMIDEAHSLGVIGATGKGVSEHFQIDVSDVDIWMGTLSKSLASCGGYVGGSKEIIDYLKYTASGFIYSVGMTPANTAAAIRALQIMNDEPQRIKQMITNADYFRMRARENGLNIGQSAYSAIVPIIIGDTTTCMEVSKKIQNKGINVMPITPPAVPEHTARLRFFINTLHTPEQIDFTIDAMVEAMAGVAPIMA